ncbi:MAG: MlaE family ABC transporter permease [Bdellovibrionota bacterium]
MTNPWAQTRINTSMLNLAISPITFLGKLSIFIWNSLAGLRKFHRRLPLIYQQFDFLGVQSFTVVSFSAVFIGSVVAFQTYVALHLFGMESFLGSSVGIAMMRELAPVFCGIMVAARSGAAIAAEMATMRVTEQIEAMEALGTDPFDYLVMPRIMAGTLALPLLCIYFTLIGCAAGYFIATVVHNTDGAVYIQQLAWAVDFTDVWQGLTKALIFGFFLSTLGCFYGYHAENNAEGVGVATNRAVVTASLWILFSDYILTAYLPYDSSNLFL